MPAHPIPFVCPVCQDALHVTELSCPSCHTKLSGEFQSTGLNRLTGEQLEFVEVFVRCRGNIKEVERDLKVSYPTVRSRLDQVIAAMGYPDASKNAEDDSGEVLDALGNGELSFDEALQILREDRMNR